MNTALVSKRRISDMEFPPLHELKEMSIPQLKGREWHRVSDVLDIIQNEHPRSGNLSFDFARFCESYGAISALSDDENPEPLISWAATGIGSLTVIDCALNGHPPSTHKYRLDQLFVLAAWSQVALQLYSRGIVQIVAKPREFSGGKPKSYQFFARFCCNDRHRFPICPRTWRRSGPPVKAEELLAC